MKKLERILWGVIGAMIVVWIALWWLFVLPQKGEDGQVGLVKNLEQLKEGKGSKRNKKTNKPRYKNWGIQDFYNEAVKKDKDKKDFPTKRLIKVLEEHREHLRGQYGECLKFFLKLDGPIEKWFGGGSRLDDSEFHAVFETEMSKLEQRLQNDAGVKIATAVKGGRGKSIGLDRATHLDISKMQKNFWIQAALVEAMAAETGNPGQAPRPRIWKLNYIRCGQWGSRGAAKVQPVPDETDKEIAKYFDLIKVSFEVEMLAPDIPVLLRRIMSSGRIHFHPHAFQMRKIEIKNERNCLIIPENFTVVRDGKEKVVKLVNEDFGELTFKQPKVLPAVLPLPKHAFVDFGKRKQGDTGDIPSQDEMIRGILSETLGGGEKYPFNEPPVILEVFLTVRDYAHARVQKREKEKDK